MQENYRVLSAVTILVAVILSAMGTVYSLYLKATNDSVAVFPHAFQLARTGADDMAADIDHVNNVLRKHGLEGAAYHEASVRIAKTSKSNYEVTLVPYSFYAAIDRAEGRVLPISSDNEAILTHPVGAMITINDAEGPKQVHLDVNGQSLPLIQISDYAGPILNPSGVRYYALVLPDAKHNAIMEQTPANKRIRVAIWDLANWKGKEAQAAVKELDDYYANRDGVKFSSTTVNYLRALSTMGLLLFIGFFVSLVFFAACCSLLYFRLFTEIDNDRSYFQQLQQVGVNNRELKSLALGQAAVVFLAPFIFGLIHSTFAMKPLGTLLQKTVLQLGWMVALGYLVLYLAYFGATFTIYWNAVGASLNRHNEPTGV